jgi:ribonuclease HI
VRRAKKAYWRDRIDGVKTDADLYSLVRWHKLSPNQQDSPLVVNGETITDTAEKEEALRRELLDRFNNADDLPAPPEAEDYTQDPLPWDTEVSMEEAERYAIGVASTSPGADGITVRLLKACWADVKNLVRAIYQRCLELEFYPGCWRTAEVTMIPKAGKKDRTSARSMRPIALLSCIGKGLERLVARRIATTAITHDVISPQHVGAVPKRSAMDIVAAFTHDVEQALAVGKRVTMVTMDVQGAFDALLKNRLLRRMAQQGWPPACIRFIDSFLTERRVQVRLGNETTPRYPVACGTPQGSPLSPILYTLYLAELLNQDRALRFGYADDINIYRSSKTLDENVQLLANDIQAINQWGARNKVTFAPEKLEAIHITRQKDSYSPSIPISGAITLEPIAPAADRSQTALRWLGVWFDRQLSFKPHVAHRAAATKKLVNHLRSLANTAHGPPPDAVRKAVVTCVLPSLLYGTEAWYEGRTRNPRYRGKASPSAVSTRVGQHIAAIQAVLVQAARAILPVYRTTPLPILFREAGIPSAEVALEEARWRLALRLQTTDRQHPLTHRAVIPHNRSGTKTGERQQPRTKIQRLGLLLPAIPRPALIAPHFSQGCRTDPTLGVEKKAAAKEFKEWWASLDSSTITVFSDGSEQYSEGEKRVTYGYAIYQAQVQVATGRGSLHTLSHVFDAEAIGACRALQHAAQIARPTDAAYLCIDSTSVIWCLRGTASNSSQWAFLQCQEMMNARPNVKIRWAPGHTDIEGNEAADRLADVEAKEPSTPFGLAAQPTVSGIRTIRKAALATASTAWWSNAKSKLSDWYT